VALDRVARRVCEVSRSTGTNRPALDALVTRELLGRGGADHE
jgi:hypothetical protein